MKRFYKKPTLRKVGEQRILLRVLVCVAPSDITLTYYTPTLFALRLRQSPFCLLQLSVCTDFCI